MQLFVSIQKLTNWHKFITNHFRSIKIQNTSYKYKTEAKIVYLKYYEIS